MSKKKVLFVTESHKMASGFGTYAKQVLPRLAATGKYELAEFASYGDFNSVNNPSLTCIDVNDVATAEYNWATDNWTNFSTNCNTTEIEGYSSQRKLIKVLDVFGRSIIPKPNMPLLYIYDDGTTEKKLIIN